MTASVWRGLPASHRRWIVLKALVATAAINAALNAAIAWLSAGSQETVEMWGAPLVETSVGWNAIGTLFLLPLITCLLTTTAVHRDVRLGALASLSRLRIAHRWLAALPPARLRRGVVFGGFAVVALAPPVILALAVAGVADFTREQFIAGQVVFATALGAILTPIIALYAMADPADSD